MSVGPIPSNSRKHKGPVLANLWRWWGMKPLELKLLCDSDFFFSLTRFPDEAKQTVGGNRQFVDLDS